MLRKSELASRSEGQQGTSADSQHTMDELASDQSPLAVRLVVGAGTHAGVAADIQVGIYMIGRDRECQIRPKSSSVSSRHCLVQHVVGAVRVFDLESEHGTFVNDERLEPKKWRTLHHGDRLRCGKYWFDVAIYERDPEDGSETIHDSQEIDIPKASPTTSASADEGLFDFDKFEPGVTEGSLADSTTGLVDAAPAEIAKSTPAKPHAKSTQSSIPKPKIKPLRSSSGGGFSVDLSMFGSWKTIGALISVTVIAFYLVWTIYNIQNGSPVKILRDID